MKKLFKDFYHRYLLNITYLVGFKKTYKKHVKVLARVPVHFISRPSLTTRLGGLRGIRNQLHE